MEKLTAIKANELTKNNLHNIDDILQQIKDCCLLGVFSTKYYYDDDRQTMPKIESLRSLGYDVMTGHSKEQVPVLLIYWSNPVNTKNEKTTQL